jgi:hypothetical protein
MDEVTTHTDLVAVPLLGTRKKRHVAMLRPAMKKEHYG